MKTVGETLKQNVPLVGISRCVPALPQSRQLLCVPDYRGKVLWELCCSSLICLFHFFCLCKYNGCSDILFDAE